MRLMLRCLLFLVPGVGVAQTDFGVKGGINVADIVMTNFIDRDIESDLRLKLGAHGGFFVNGMLDNRIGIAGELLYSNKGVRSTTAINLHYITLPLLIRYKMTDRIFAEIGPEPGYLFSARSPHGNVSSTYNNKLDIGLDAGFQLDYPRIVVGMRYCVGLFSVRKVQDTSPFSNEEIKYQNRVLQVALGYKLWKLE